MSLEILHTVIPELLITFKSPFYISTQILCLDTIDKLIFKGYLLFERLNGRERERQGENLQTIDLLPKYNWPSSQIWARVKQRN